MNNMLLLIFTIGDQKYGIDTKDVIEISPIVEVNKIPNSESYIFGLINYRGEVVPVIDLSEVLLKTPTRFVFSSRIILLNYKKNLSTTKILGLLAPNVTETILVDKISLKNPGVDVKNAEYLGDVLIHNKDIVQKIEVNDILSDEIKELLFNS
jgi:chemotaxis-related protein WspB